MTQTTSQVTISSIGKWKSYPAYKDSGVEWLGKIPAHWEATCVKYLAGNRMDIVQTGPFGAQLHASDYTDEGVPLILIRNVNNLRIEDSNIPKISLEKANSLSMYCLEIGDIVFSRVGSIGRVALVSEREKGWLISGQMLRLRINNADLYHYFAIFYFCSDMAMNFVDLKSVGSTRESINTEILRNTPFPLPPFLEQRSIATFLDRETAKINDLIAKKEQLIELLQEKRTALISHAVTKGLDPTVPMKDSGVEWLEEIPAHWEMKRLKFCLDSIEQGWSPTCENRPAEIDEWGVLKVGCVNGIEFRPNENKALPAETQPISELEINQGDILVSRANTRELLGSASVVKQVRPHLLLCDKLYRLKILPGTVNSFYLVLAMGSSIIRFQLERDATGASNSMQNISQSTILNLIIPLPHLSEQQIIVAYLDHETAKIDALISRVRDGIEKLREYRTAIISAAVTGKIDVRGEIASQDEMSISSTVKS